MQRLHSKKAAPEMKSTLEMVHSGVVAQRKKAP
jgi:hypothetical protein